MTYPQSTSTEITKLNLWAVQLDCLPIAIFLAVGAHALRSAPPKVSLSSLPMTYLCEVLTLFIGRRPGSGRRARLLCCGCDGQSDGQCALQMRETPLLTIDAGSPNSCTVSRAHSTRKCRPVQALANVYITMTSVLCMPHIHSIYHVLSSLLLRPTIAYSEDMDENIHATAHIVRLMHIPFKQLQ